MPYLCWWISLFCLNFCIVTYSIDMKSLRLKLESLHPGKVLKSLVENNRRQMGFSGATVYEVSAIWEEQAKVQDLFVKEISLKGPTEQSARMKFERNIRSYFNEIFFLTEIAPSLREAGVSIPNSIFIEQDSDGSADEAQFLFISESMTGRGEQLAEFSTPQFSACIDTMARIHALYQDSVESLHGLWPIGTHLALSHRPSGELDELGDAWKTFCASFGSNFAPFADLGYELQEIAPFVANQLNPTYCLENDGRHFTLAHGDYKPGNLFFSDDGTVHVIDFQWSGVGIGATDMIYLIATGSSDSFVEALMQSNVDIDASVEDTILKPYYDRLITHYKTLHDGIINSMTFAQLKMDFRLSVLDYVRWIMCARLKGDIPDKFRQRRENVDLNLGAYRRSETMVKFLFTLVQLYLPSVKEMSNSKSK
jgi:thiamine kinase-like enzyme